MKTEYEPNKILYFRMRTEYKNNVEIIYCRFNLLIVAGYEQHGSSITLH